MMKRVIFQILFFAIFINCLNAQITNANSLKHSFACTDYTQGIVCIISDEGKLVWQYPAEQ